MKLLLPCASAGINGSATRPSRFSTSSTAFDQGWCPIARALRAPEVVKQLPDLGAEPGGETPREFSRRIRAESTAWSQVFKKSSMQLD
jgi:tripartite-type tricarboxylate transporter receptor subunit TctC